MTDAEVARLQVQIDDTYTQFIDAVAEGRQIKRGCGPIG